MNETPEVKTDTAVQPEGVKADIWEVRLMMVKLWAEGFGFTEFASKVREAFHIERRDLAKDWKSRKRWFPVLTRLKDTDFIVSELSLRMQRLMEAGWDTYRLAKECNNHNAMVGAVAQLSNIIKQEIELEQSLGILPKVADKLEVKEENVNLPNVSNTDMQVLNEAAAILNKKHPSSSRSGQIH